MHLLQMCLNYPFTSFSGFPGKPKTWCEKNMQGTFKMSACIVKCDFISLERLHQLGKVVKTIHFTYRNMNILVTLMFAIPGQAGRNRPPGGDWRIWPMHLIGDAGRDRNRCVTSFSMYDVEQPFLRLE